MKKRWFNGFDIGVVALVVLAVLAWFFILNRPAPPEQEVFAGTQAVFFLEVANLTPEQAQQISVGDRLIEGTRHLPVGYVQEIQWTPHEMRIDDDETQTISFVPLEGRYTLILSVVTEVVETDRDILAQGQVAIKGGQVLHITGPGYAFANGVILGWQRGA